ncbi:MAG: ornithine carbamoyltransferase [Lentisphaerae bacterium]|nr:ornithine carbamoyltransferase [Lentisphaerota bacterium]
MNSEINLKGRSLLTLHDVTDEEFLRLVDLSDRLKQKKKSGVRGDLLVGKHIAIILEKMSTRTRCAVAVAMADEGGMAQVLSSGEIHLGKKESVADTARVLGRMFDGILYRGYQQKTVELLAQYSGVPVWNGLTDEAHPTQALADLMTVREFFGDLHGRKLVFVGDGRNNVATSLMLACAKTGMHFVDCTPEALKPSETTVGVCRKIAEGNGGSVSVVSNPSVAVKGANVIYTDVWISMGEESMFAERLALLRPYQVNMDMMRKTGNLDSEEVIFLHCLPALHDYKTELTLETGALEVTDDVFEASFSRVFDQAENRVHTTKAIFVSSLCN